MQTKEPKVWKPLGIRATPEQHKLLTEAAAREHRSVNSYVLRAAIAAAEQRAVKPRKSRAEITAIFEAARAEFQAHNPTGRDPLAELLAERREASENE